MVRFSRRLSSAAVAAGVALTASLAVPAMAHERGKVRLLPLHGVSLNVGSKHLVGYFLAEAKTCNVTLLMSNIERDGEVVPPTGSAARVRQTLQPNTTARIETVEGESLELACLPGAEAMTVRVLKQVAAYKPVG